MQSFAYVRANSADDAVREAAAGASAAFLAGGTTLIDLMKLEAMRPERVIDINDLSVGHSEINVSADGLQLGALTRMGVAARHPAVVADYPVIAQSLQLAASAQLRNMATLAGNVLQRTRCNYFRDPGWGSCNKRHPGTGCAALEGVNRKHAVLGTSEHCIATYPGDFAQALIALDASVDVVGTNGPRTLPFAELHREPADTPEIETTLAPDELITGFTVPAGPWTRRSVYVKVRDRESYEFALASAAVALELDGDRVRTARVALGGVATKPWRAREAEALLTGKPLDEANTQAAARAAFATAQGRGANAFKIELGRRTLVRALNQAAALRV